MPSVLLADVEIMVAFLATSIATYRPLYRRVIKGIVPSTAQGLVYKPEYKYSDGPKHVTRIFAGGKQDDRTKKGGNGRGIVVTDQIELIHTPQSVGLSDGTTVGCSRDSSLV